MEAGIRAAKLLFFDRQAVLSRLTSVETKALRRFGARVRGAARSSIRKARQPSRPGQPPRDVTGLLKRFLFFVFEPSRHSVVIGPARLARSSDAPAKLEHGQGRLAKRPYMEPAYRRIQPSLKQIWAEAAR